MVHWRTPRHNQVQLDPDEATALEIDRGHRLYKGVLLATGLSGIAWLIIASILVAVL